MQGQDIEVTDNPGESRYEARVGGELAATLRYMRAPHVIAFVHTEVLPGFEGRGVGGGLAHSVLESARAAGDKVLPGCAFLADYILKHPEYQPLVYQKKSGGKH